MRRDWKRHKRGLALLSRILFGSMVACQPAPPPQSSWPTETIPTAQPPVAPLVSPMPVPSASEVEPPEPSGETATLTAPQGEDPTLYDEPASVAVATAQKGDSIRIFRAQRTDDGTVWYYGQLDQGAEGWVNGGGVNFVAPTGRVRPFVVLPGGGSVYAQPEAAEAVQELEGGSVVAVESAPEGSEDWFYSGGGWILRDSLFQPTCIAFNGYLPLVVRSGGTTVHDTAAYQIPVRSRLDGGELVFPSEVTENATGTWFKTDQGWISGQSLFYPFCES